MKTVRSHRVVLVNIKSLSRASKIHLYLSFNKEGRASYNFQLARAGDTIESLFATQHHIIWC